MAVTTKAPERPRMRTFVELLEEFPALGLPLLKVGTSFLVDGSIAVSGSVSPDVVATAELTINGQRVFLTEFGTFCAVVRPDGRRGLTFSLEAQARPRVTLEVPPRAS